MDLARLRAIPQGG